MAKKFIEVFKVGTHNGIPWTNEDIQAIVDNYDTNFLRAPIIIGHKGPFEPEAPAYGYVDELINENGVLKASFADMNQQFKEAVNQGKFNARSVEIFKDLDGKKPYLKAVAFLGSSTPAVKGLEVVKFSDAEADHFDFDITDNNESEISKLQAEIDVLKKFREKYTETEGLIEKFKTDIAKLEEEKKSVENRQYLEKFVDSKKLTPKQRDLSCELMKDMSEDNSKKFKEFIESLPVQFETDEIATKTESDFGNDTEIGSSTVRFSDESVKTDNEIKKIMKKNECSYAEAYDIYFKGGM